MYSTLTGLYGDYRIKSAEGGEDAGRKPASILYACLVAAWISFFPQAEGSAARKRRGGQCLQTGGKMPHDKHYNSARHKVWAEKVLRRAGYLCEECRRYGRLDSHGLPVRATTAHHIKHRDEYPELQYDVMNGRALCERCHNRAHPEKGGYWK